MICSTCHGKGIAEYGIPAHQGWDSVQGGTVIVDEEIVELECEDCRGTGLN